MNNVLLLGAEDVARGGQACREAAQALQVAANTLYAAQEQQRQWMEEWMLRFEAAVREMKVEPPVSPSGST